MKVGEPEDLPRRPFLRTASSWMPSVLYTADLGFDPRNIHMLPFIYWRKLTGNSETIVTFLFLHFLDLPTVLKHVVLQESLIR